MKILERLSPTSSRAPRGLTIGSFDGIHLGHQLILRRLRELVGDGTIGVITFSNHPSQLFPGRPPVTLLLTKEQKTEAFERSGVDLLYLLEFSLSLAEKSYEEFLAAVREVYPFDFLVLGESATFGKGREGTPEKIKDLASKWGFEVEYLDKVQIDGEVVSSGAIRKCLSEGNVEKAERFLGRNYPN